MVICVIGPNEHLNPKPLSSNAVCKLRSEALSHATALKAAPSCRAFAALATRHLRGPGPERGTKVASSKVGTRAASTPPALHYVQRSAAQLIPIVERSLSVGGRERIGGIPERRPSTQTLARPAKPVFPFGPSLLLALLVTATLLPATMSSANVLCCRAAHRWESPCGRVESLQLCFLCFLCLQLTQGISMGPCTVINSMERGQAWPSGMASPRDRSSINDREALWRKRN